MLMKELLLVCMIAMTVIVISVAWKGESMFSEEEYENYLQRCEQGVGLK